MEFFNPKTEVLRFQFTSYGLEELSKGKFDPESFVALDEGVAYDPTLSEEEFLEEIRQNRVFIKTNKVPFELAESEIGQAENAACVAYPVREELDGLTNLSRSSFHIRTTGTDVVSATKDEGGLEVTLDPLFILKSAEIPASEIPNRSEEEASDIYFVGGKYFSFKNGHILLDLSEGGTIPQPENFECFLYELIDGEEVRIDLKGELSQRDLYVPREKQQNDFEVKVLCDEEIPDEILCAAKSTMYSGNQTNVFLVDDGVVSSESFGKTCKVSSASKPVVYFGRDEGELGDGCRND